LESRVSERTAQLTRANEEIQKFAHIVSHDLRAPLINIVGFSRELEDALERIQSFIKTSSGSFDRPLSETIEIEMPEALAFIRSSTTKMDNLINTILKIAREGQRRLQAQQIDLVELIDEARAAIRHQLSEVNGQCTIEPEVGAIFSDRLSLEQVIGNLLDNAVKYREQGRALRIEVRTRPVGSDRVSIEVSDNGRGIAKHDLQRVFDLFRRVGPQDRPGQGIGLAYVQALVRNLGGEVTLVSELGRGSSFTVILPLDIRTAEILRAA
jgi:signal transduction histidine kinase